MNTKIGQSFGLALLMAIAVIGTMFALGMFSIKPASAVMPATGISVVVTPANARDIGQYTILVTGASNTIDVGGTITVTFGSKFTVPSSIAASDVKLKTNVISGNSGTANQLVSSGGITISGRAVTITVPDMDTASTTNGDNGISSGDGASFTVTFLQAAGIQNPNQSQDANGTGTGGLTVKTSADTTAVAAYTMTAITKKVTYSPTSGARGTVVTVSGRGFAKDCSDCKIRFNPQNTVTPTTGNE